MISFRGSRKEDETALEVLFKDPGVHHHVGGAPPARLLYAGPSTVSLHLIFNDGFIAERDDVVQGVLLFTKEYNPGSDSSITTEAKITIFVVRKTEELLRDMLLDIYHRSLLQNHYEISYADIESSNCFSMEVLIKNGYRVSEEFKNNKTEKREGYRLYKLL